MRNFIVWGLFVLCFSAEAQPGKNLGSKSGKALDLLARGGVATVYTDSIRAEVNNLNCNVDRVAASQKKTNATVCSGVNGKRNLQLNGEKATEMFKLLETVTVAQSLPAADSIEVRKMSCRFQRRGGASCLVIK